jgi:hypothetical protein
MHFTLFILAIGLITASRGQERDEMDFTYEILYRTCKTDQQQLYDQIEVCENKLASATEPSEPPVCDCQADLLEQRERLLLQKCPPASPCPTPSAAVVVANATSESPMVCKCDCPPAECNCHYDGKASLLLREMSTNLAEMKTEHTTKLLEVQTVLKNYGTGLVEAVGAREELRGDIQRLHDFSQRMFSVLSGSATSIDKSLTDLPSIFEELHQSQEILIRSVNASLFNIIGTIVKEVVKLDQVRHLCESRETHDHTMARMYDDYTACRTSAGSEVHGLVKHFIGKDSTELVEYLEKIYKVLDVSVKLEKRDVYLIIAIFAGFSFGMNLLLGFLLLYFVCCRSGCCSFLCWWRKPAEAEDEAEETEFKPRESSV